MFRFPVVAVVLAGISASPLAAQAVQGGPAPGTGNGAGIAAGNQEENASYNRVIGKVGVDPVGTEKAKREAKEKAVPALPMDVRAGAAVRDVNGLPLGTVESIDGDSAILVFGSDKVRFPLIGFGKDGKGLLINLSTQDFHAAIQKARSDG